MRIILLSHSSDQGHRLPVERYFPYPRGKGWNGKGNLSPVEFYWVPKKPSRLLYDLDDVIACPLVIKENG
jgi:hypothetical protein